MNMRYIHNILLAALSSITLTKSNDIREICFNNSNIPSNGFEVVQIAPPPRNGDLHYPYYPLTGVATMQLNALADSGPRYRNYYFQWGNRSNAPLYARNGRLLPRKPNIQPSARGARRQRTEFSSVTRADACTLAQTASILGLASRGSRIARAAGITLVPEAMQPDVGAVGAKDACVIANGQLPARAAGVMLDYEAQDGRSGSETVAFLEAFAALVHGAGKKAVLLVDPLDAPSQRYSGISAANANRIVRTFDQTTIFLWSRNRQGSIPASYAAQKEMIAAGGPFDSRRILIDFDLAGTSLDDARFARSVILRDELAGVILWRNAAILGGPCQSPVNQKIAALVFGR